MARRPPVVTNAGNSLHWPGAYEHVLRVTCTEAGSNPYFYLTEAADDPLSRREFEADEADRIDHLIEQRRGTPVHCQEYQLPEGVSGMFKIFSSDCQRCFTVDPTDVVTYRPHTD